MIKEVPINDNWLFSSGFDKACLEREYSWENSYITSLPHNIYECGEDYFDERNMQRVVTYSRVLTVPDSYLGKRLLLRFEGVLSYVEVYVNGIFVTSHKGETPFTADVTAPLLYNYENRIVLKVDSGIRKDVPCSGVRGPHCGFGGIHRDVVFLICDGRDIRDVCMRYNAADQTVTADVELYDWYPDTELDGEILDGGKSLCSLALRSVQGSHVRLKGDASGATLWSPETPKMYTALIRLKQGGNVLDCKYVPFGFKTAVFLRDGFYLNGVRTKLIGLLRADSYPVIGRAATEQTERRDARLIKEAGCNAVRTMGLAGKDFIDECNKIGLMVIEDVYGDGYVGSGEWRDAFIGNVTDMVVRDRNAPSIIGWGVRVNNSRDCDELYFKANQAAKQADPTRNTIGARGFTGSHLFEDVFAYGSKHGPYSKANKLFVPHFIGEHSGGVVAKPYDPESVRVRQALAHLEVLDEMLGSSSAGAFGMSFCDFAAGRGHGSGDGLNHCGVFDAFRNPKLAAYAYMSQRDDNPVLALSGNLAVDEYDKKLYVFTNADSVVLYRDDRKVGEFFPDRKRFPHIKHPPIAIDDFCGDLPAEEVGKSHCKLFKSLLKETEEHGMNFGFLARKQLFLLSKLSKLSKERIIELLEDYKRVPPKGATYRFEGVYGGEVKCTKTLSPDFTKTLRITRDPSDTLECLRSYGRFAFTLCAEDGKGNPLAYEFMPVTVTASGALQVEGNGHICLKGGYGGFFVRSIGAGTGRVTVTSELGAQSFSLECTYTDWERF